MDIEGPREFYEEQNKTNEELIQACKLLKKLSMLVNVDGDYGYWAEAIKEAQDFANRHLE